MIENLLGGGGGGGTVDTIQAGTGISVNATNPASPIITNTSLNTDETAKVSSNDTTAGYLNGKLVAGSNVTFTENNNGGNETLTIAATVPVTSVNGLTGAVTVAAGDTTYSLTILDAENTTTARDVVSFTIAGGTLSDGEIISIDTVTDGLNNSGGTATLTSRMVVNGTAQTSWTSSWGTTSLVWQDKQRVNIWRDGSTLWVGYPTTWSAPTTEGFVMRVQNTFYATGYASSTTPNFANAITISLRLQWNVANASTYIRIRNARVVKLSGQYT